MIRKHLSTKLDRLLHEETGSITIWSLFNLILLCTFAGLAIDVNNAVQSRTQLQGAADAAGHAALYYRLRNPEDFAIQKAQEVAAQNMPTSIFGNIIATTDVEFGDWDSVDRTFTVDSGNRTAVRVTARRVASRANAVRTFLLRFMGMSELDINAVSVWDAEDGFCPPRSPDKKRGEGFFAVGMVDMQTANSFYDGFCVHSEDYVKVSQDNYFEEGVIVSMPDQSDLQVPASGMEKNDGLPEALRSMNYNLESFFNGLPDLISEYNDPSSETMPDFITDTSAVHEVNLKNPASKLVQSMLLEGAVNRVNCKGSNLTIDQDAVLHDVVIITDCNIKFMMGAALENVTLITTSTDTKSIDGPQGVRLGANDYCSTGEDGVTVITMGGASFAAEFQGYGVNMIAKSDLNLAAAADGLAGVNFMSGGEIDITALSDFGFCANGPPQDFIIPVIRMVM